MPDNETEANSKASAAPYVGFGSFKNMLGGFKEHVLPIRVDRSMLGNFSGIVGTQLLATLRFFDLINSAGAPTQHLESFVAAYGTDKWPQEVEQQLRRAYAPLFELNLQSASPSQFTERFRSVYPSEGDTLRKAMTFFLNAARDAQIPISPYILKGKKPRSPANGVKKAKRAAPSGRASGQESSDGNRVKEDNPPPPDDFKRDLLSKFPAFDPSWPDDIKAKWFEGFGQFMGMANK